ncbi:hypothetical protein RIF29_40383 [Crotalaria pallida]|uniref:Uncharacterized protein n=1 Tax=Crotalaria pallida TaxID=3830 RepID=A0AAN9HRM8_CROPI
MPSSESVKPSHQSPSGEGEMHKKLDKEIRDMVSAITHRVTDFHKSGSTHHLENEDDHDVRIITLAGTNDGATLKSEFDEKSSKHSDDDDEEEHDEALSTYVNSNFQAVNNSIMLGGSYSANDPGVHVDISDFTEPSQSYHHKAKGHDEKKHGKKGKKKEKESSKSEHASGLFD